MSLVAWDVMAPRGTSTEERVCKCGVWEHRGTQVAKCVSMLRPDGLFLELCSERDMLLDMDKDDYLEVGIATMIHDHVPRYCGAHKDKPEMLNAVTPQATKAITLSSTLEDVRAGKTEIFPALYNLMLSSVARDHDAFIAEEFRTAFDTFLALHGPEGKSFVLLGDRPISITVARFWR